MTIEPVPGLLSSAAGMPRALSNGADVQRAQAAAIRLQRQSLLNNLADRASGVAEPDAEEMQAQDRDADGRQPWQFLFPPGATNGESGAAAKGRARNADAARGSAIDLIG